MVYPRIDFVVDGVSVLTALHPRKAHLFTVPTIIVSSPLKHIFKSSLTYHIVLLPTVGKGRGCLLYHIVS